MRPPMTAAVGDGSRLWDWFHALAQRLARVIVLNRDWSSAVTPTMLQQTASAQKPIVGIFLDPPYLIEERTDLYEGDESQGSGPALESFQWAVEHGEIYRIAYACHKGDFPLPPGWTEAEPKLFRSIRRHDRKERQDTVIFSPACLARPAQPQQMGMVL